MTNEELVGMYRNGNQEAIIELHEQNKGMIVRAIRSLGVNKNDIDDAHQVAFIVLLNCVRSYCADGGRTFVSFYYLCLRRQLVDFMLRNSPIRITKEAVQKGKKHVSYEKLPTNFDVAKEDDNLMEVEEEKRLLREALKELSSSHKQIVQMYIEGKRFSEISKELGVTAQAVTQRFQRILDKMREHVNGIERKVL